MPTIIIRKKYLPFVGNWEDQKEFPIKSSEFLHRDCVYFDISSKKCLKTVTDGEGNRVIRNVRVNPDELSCKDFRPRKFCYE